jgi:tRNA pseudouridine55 synthase
MESAGVILYPKPPGPTSHDVVASVRRRLRETGLAEKVGHAGTLDPFASGLLLVLVGRATRVQRFVMALPKVYRAVARLGWRSDTGDRDGELEHTGRVPDRIEIPTGRLLQRPPAYSAVKVGGERLYRRARRGEAVEAEPRPVEVHRAEVLWREGDRAAIEIECSAGTYVRQLVADLGDAYCEELERTRIGPFTLEDADPEQVVPLADALSFLPPRELDEREAERVAHGQPVPAAVVATSEGAAARPTVADENPATRRLVHEGRLLALAEPRDDQLKPVVVLAP